MRIQQHTLTPETLYYSTCIYGQCSHSLLPSATGSKTFNNLRLKHSAVKGNNHVGVGVCQAVRRRLSEREEKTKSGKWMSRGEGRPVRGTEAPQPQAHLPMPQFPLCGFLAWHIDTNNSVPGGCHMFLFLSPRPFFHRWLLHVQKLDFLFFFLVLLCIDSRELSSAWRSLVGQT